MQILKKQNELSTLTLKEEEEDFKSISEKTITPSVNTTCSRITI